MGFSCPDFSVAPLLVIWETTRSCALACSHCRASAELGRHPDELTTSEGFGLLDQIADMGTPIVIFSGGDPLNRPDLEELVRHAKRRGLRTGTIPAATPALTRERLAALEEAGLDQLALSLDGPTPELHDRLRRTPGAFERTIAAAGDARALGLPLQINTCFSRANIDRLEEMIALVASLGAVFWEVFLLIPIGRGRALGGLAPGRIEALFERLSRLDGAAGFVVKITEGQAYRRFLARAGKKRTRPMLRGAPIHGGVTATAQAVNAGKGFLFVDHVGRICPSGFLPVACGDARRDSLSAIYRDSPMFRELRDPRALTGKCGRCEFAAVCGGSRARAHALTGDHRAADPACEYEPLQEAVR